MRLTQVLLSLMMLLGLCCAQQEATTSEYDTYDAALSGLSPVSSIREYRKALVSMEKLAKSGKTRASADAMAVLSQIYIFGSHGKKIVTQQQPFKSFYYANQSSNAGSPKGHNMLAFLYRYGLGTDQDVTKAAELEKFAAELNYLPSMMVVAYKSFEQDDNCDKALRTYRLAATVASGKVDASFLGDYASLQPLSREADELGDDAAERHARQLETVEYWQFLADRKDPRGLYELGRIHHLGLHGRPRNLELAVELYSKAGGLENAEAMAALGRLQSIGHGCELNMGEALRKLRLGTSTSVERSPNETKAAVEIDAGRGSGEAEATLGILLQRQVFTSEDSRTGVRYLRQGAALGNADAMFELGEAAARDGHVEEANQYFTDAVKRGHVRSARALARHYEAGVGVGESCQKAATYYKFVCDVGPWLDDPFGPRHVVKAYWEGRTTDALFLALYTADQGYAASQYNAAWMLLRGKGTKDFESSSRGHNPRQIAADLLIKVGKQSDRAVDGFGVHVSASLLLGDLLSAAPGGGEGLPARNDSLAVASYSRAAGEGNPEAMEKLASMLSRGRGVPERDFERAEELLVACSKAVQREQAPGFRLRKWALGYHLMWLQLSALLFQLKEVLFPSKFQSYQPTHRGDALLPHEAGEGPPGFGMEFSLWGEEEGDSEGRDGAMSVLRGGDGNLLHKARSVLGKPLKDAQRRLSRSWGGVRNNPLGKGGIRHPHQASHLKHLQGERKRQAWRLEDVGSCSSDDRVWFSQGELFMLALDQSPVDAANTRCLRVDGSIGACDLSAIYAVVPQEANSTRCTYLLLSPFMSRLRASTKGEEAARPLKPTRRTSPGAGQGGGPLPPVHAMELPFGGFTLTGDLSFVPSNMHGFLGIRTAENEGGGSISLLEEEAGDPGHSRDHEHTYMCCLARTHCGEHEGLELSAQGAWHCGDAANLWQLQTVKDQGPEGQEGSVKLVASSNGKCAVMTDQTATLQSSQHSLSGEPCLSLRVVSMGVRSRAQSSSPPTPMLAEDGEAVSTPSPVLEEARLSEASGRGREGVMLEISANGQCIQRQGGNHPVAVLCDAAAPGQRWRVRAEYDRLVHGFNAFQLVQEGEEGCLRARASHETGHSEHLVHFSSCRGDDLYSWWVVSDNSGASYLRNLGLVRAGEAGSSCLGVAPAFAQERSSEAHPVSLVSCQKAVLSVRA